MCDPAMYIYNASTPNAEIIPAFIYDLIIIWIEGQIEKKANPKKNLMCREQLYLRFAIVNYY